MKGNVGTADRAARVVLAAPGWWLAASAGYATVGGDRAGSGRDPGSHGSRRVLPAVFGAVGAGPGRQAPHRPRLAPRVPRGSPPGRRTRRA